MPAEGLAWAPGVALAKVLAAVEAGVQAAATQVLQVSDEHIPVDPDHRLENTGKVISYGHTAAIIYDTEYAVVQHERTDYHHEAGQTAKFLQQAGVSEAVHSAEIVAEHVRAVTLGRSVQ